MYLQGGLDVADDNPELRLLLMNIHFSFILDPLKFLNKKASFRALFTGLSTQCFNNNDRKCDQIYKVEETSHLVPNTESFVLQMLSDERNALPKKYEAKNKSASNIFISRVSLGDINNAIKLTK